MAHRYWRHRLAEFMDDLGLSNRGFATIMEPTDNAKRDSLRNRVAAWRKGRGMEMESAERVARALSQVAGRTVTVEELLDVETPGADEVVLLLEQAAAALMQAIDALRAQDASDLPNGGSGHGRQAAMRPAPDSAC